MAQRKSTKLTIGSFDLLKGVAIIVMILSHTIGRYDLQRYFPQGGILNIFAYIGPVSIPAFFVISGMGFREKSPSAMLKKTFSDIMIPYFLVMGSYALFFPLVRYPFTGYWNEVFTYAIRYVAAFLLGNIQYGRIVFGQEIYWCTSMWFFLALFVALNVLNGIVKIKRVSVQVICVLLLTLLGNYLYANDCFWFCIDRGLRSLGFCYIGYVVKKYKLYDCLQGNLWTYLITLPIFFLLPKLEQLDETVFLYVLSTYFAECCCTLPLVFAGVALGKRDWVGTSWLKKIGMYSYWIVCIHGFETEAFPWYIMSQSLRHRPIFAFCLELSIKAVFIIGMCVILKKIANWRYRRKMRAYGKREIS